MKAYKYIKSGTKNHAFIIQSLISQSYINKMYGCADFSVLKNDYLKICEFHNIDAYYDDASILKIWIQVFEWTITTNSFEERTKKEEKLKYFSKMLDK